jgi:predicted ABC-type ATPase
MNLFEWYKSNKKYLISSVVEILRNTSDSPLLVLTAGYPGSGKTEYIRSSAKLSTLPSLDLDDLVKLFPDYSSKNYYSYRDVGARLLASVFEKMINCKYSFVLEGTFSSKISLLNIERALKRGYQVRVIRLKTPANKSLQYAKIRQFQTGRPINEELFWQTVEKVDEVYNLAKLKFSNNVLFEEVENE